MILAIHIARTTAFLAICAALVGTPSTCLGVLADASWDTTWAVYAFATAGVAAGLWVGVMAMVRR